MKSRTLISFVHRPGSKAVRSRFALVLGLAFALRSRTVVDMGFLRLRLRGDEFRLLRRAAGARPLARFAKQESEDDRERHAVEQRLERILIVWKLAFAAGT